jgi:spore cortex formation protein SpoVR/YcgB (stage V sporulation)
MKDMTNEILKGVVAHADGHIAKHKANILVQCKNSVGVGEHSDHVETIEKELEQIAHYEDLKDVVKKHFSEYTEKSLLNE